MDKPTKVRVAKVLVGFFAYISFYAFTIYLGAHRQTNEFPAIVTAIGFFMIPGTIIASLKSASEKRYLAAIGWSLCFMAWFQIIAYHYQPSNLGSYYPGAVID